MPERISAQQSKRSNLRRVSKTFFSPHKLFKLKSWGENRGATMKAILTLMILGLLVAACASNTPANLPEEEPENTPATDQVETIPDTEGADVVVEPDVEELTAELADLESLDEELDFSDLDNLDEELNFG
jgi:hypothetical protein